MNASTTPDLSKFHGPVGSLLSTYASPERRQALQLSDQQDKFCRAQGCLAGSRVLTDEQVEALRDELSTQLPLRLSILRISPQKRGASLLFAPALPEGSEPECPPAG